MNRLAATFGCLLTLALLSCAPSWPRYHADRSVFSGDCDGYREAQIDSTTFEISFCGAYDYSSRYLYPLYRASEVVTSKGYDGFIVLSRDLTRNFRTSMIRIRAVRGENLLAFNAHRLLQSLGPDIAKQ